jgi:hypothetical protein
MQLLLSYDTIIRVGARAYPCSDLDSTVLRQHFHQFPPRQLNLVKGCVACGALKIPGQDSSGSDYRAPALQVWNPELKPQSHQKKKKKKIYKN